MNREQREELLSRGLDGELTADERGELDRLLASDPELKKMEAAWVSYADVLRSQAVPPATTPEAAWADVQRAIRLDREGGARGEVSLFGWRLGWAGVIIAMVMLGFSTIALRQVLSPGAGRAPEEKDVEVEFVESDLPGASPMVYEDAETGWTVIWVAGLDGASSSAGT